MLVFRCDVESYNDLFFYSTHSVTGSIHVLTKMLLICHQFVFFSDASLSLNFLPFLILRKWGSRSASSAYQASVLFIVDRSDIMEHAVQQGDTLTACNSTRLCSPRTSYCLLFHMNWNLKHFTRFACSKTVCVCVHSRKTCCDCGCILT